MPQDTGSVERRRRYPRIDCPRGMLVAWQCGAQRDVSPVRSLSLGGMFISTKNPPAVGEIVKLLVDLPMGELRARAIVRRSIPGKGMGIEFISMLHGDRARLHLMMKQFLRG